MWSVRNMNLSSRISSFTFTTVRDARAYIRLQTLPHFCAPSYHSTYYLMPIKVSFSIEFFTWPRTQVPLSRWSRLRDRIRRKYQGSHTTSWSFLAAETDVNPPPYLDTHMRPEICVTPSTPTDDFDTSLRCYEARTSSVAENETCPDSVSSIQIPGTCSLRIGTWYQTYVAARTALRTRIVRTPIIERSMLHGCKAIKTWIPHC